MQRITAGTCSTRPKPAGRPFLYLLLRTAGEMGLIPSWLLPRLVRVYLGAQRDRVRKLKAALVASRDPRRGEQPHNLPGELVVSLTSYPPRFTSLHKTLISLLSQDTRADRTVLWIAKQDEPFLPDDVRRLQWYGLEIRLCEDLGSYKKIVPSLRSFPSAFIVTADDDLYYPRDWLTKLVSGYVPNEKVIVCVRAHKPLLSEGEFRPYSSWTWEFVTDGQIREDLFPTGGAGALYPPGSLAVETGDTSAFWELAPTADDVWLYCMAKRAGSRHRQVGGRFPLLTWDGTQEYGLQHRNVLHGNDAQLARVWKRYCSHLGS